IEKKDFEIFLNEEPMEEYVVYNEVKSMLLKNKIMKCFTGGGPWFHFIPSIIKHIILRGEFLTSYTPYQPEISQGVLQALFEFQSMICELYNMDVANASLYDLPTAIGEALLLTSRVTGRKEVLIPSYIPEDEKLVIRNYTEPVGIKIIEIPFMEDGCLDLEYIKENGRVSGIYVETPTFFGTIETKLKDIVEIAHDLGALVIVGADPLAMGIFKPPGDYGVDIVVGDGQPLGIPPAMGGNSLGIMACKNDLKIIRQMPGRIVGLTITKDGKERGFVLALSTREQHIRREKATSNICTNEALLAIAAAIYMAVMGKEGIRRVAKKIFYNTQYAINKFKEIGLETVFKGIHFRDFTIKLNVDIVNKVLKEKGILGPRKISENIGLFAVTEIHNKKDIDELVEIIGGILK
ncbi:MAG: aminomethyl-transferring glycine dehydrogenase subunit GcvPA, partial [Candidatus Methanomethylicaceae archaeon]